VTEKRRKSGITTILSWNSRYAGEKQKRCGEEGTPNVSWKEANEGDEDGISSETLSNSQQMDYLEEDRSDGTWRNISPRQAIF